MNETMSFGEALIALKAGAHISRQGWNGRGMWLAYQPGYPAGIPINKNTAKATGLPEGTICRFTPYIMIRAADGTFGPWVPSQTDILAEDWSAAAPGA